MQFGVVPCLCCSIVWGFGNIYMEVRGRCYGLIKGSWPTAPVKTHVSQSEHAEVVCARLCPAPKTFFGGRTLGRAGATLDRPNKLLMVVCKH